MPKSNVIIIAIAISIAIICGSNRSSSNSSKRLCVMAAQTPVDYLVPPPTVSLTANSLPTPQRLTHAKAPNFGNGYPSSPNHPSTDEQKQSANFMTRFARWFGFDAGDQQPTEHLKQNANFLWNELPLSYAATANNNKHAATAQQSKAPCYLCNNYPWVPMLPLSAIPQSLGTLQNAIDPKWLAASQHGYNSVNWSQEQYQQVNYQKQQQQQKQQHQQQQQYQQHQQQQIQQQLQQHQQQHQQHQQLQQYQQHIQTSYDQGNRVNQPFQRAIKFNFPLFVAPPHTAQQSQSQQHTQLQSNSQTLAQPQPQPHPQSQAQSHTQLQSYAQPQQAPPVPHTQQALPFADNVSHFTENIGAHSELQPDRLIPTQIPPTTIKEKHNNDQEGYSPDVANKADPNAGFEIIKSEQIQHFVSSVEYPAQYEQSKAIDVPQSQSVSASTTITPTPPSISKYQHATFNANLDQHAPASQILTEIGSFVVGDSDSTVDFTASTQYLITTPQPTLNVATDSFSAASAHETQSGEEIPSHVNEFKNASTNLPAEVATLAPPTTPSSLLIEHHRVVEVPQSQSKLQSQPQSQLLSQSQLSSIQHHRDTPKHLLSSPLQHISPLINGPPRPFTRDPSELNYRLGAAIRPQPLEQFVTTTNSPSLDDTQHATVAWLNTPAPLYATAAPTSSFSVLDSGGQFAHMSPPAPPPPPSPAQPNTGHGGVKQIVIPYTRMNQPRPFEQQWQHSSSNQIDPYEQQESKLITATAEAVTWQPAIPTKGRNTKYLTKVLASNLRELLRHEQEKQHLQHLRAKDYAQRHHYNPIDLSMLQQNIDDWTEQEFTSLSHRPSTPTIRGHSKHIPAEYLTTTSAPPPPSPSPLHRQPSPQSATTFDFTDISLSTSINNLESQLSERNVFSQNRVIKPERFKTFTDVQHVDDNILREFPEPNATSDPMPALTEITKEYTTITSTTTMKPPTNRSLKDMITSYIQTIPPASSSSDSPSSKSPSAMELWEKAKVLISPLTKEKVYVVTPQPRFFPQRFGYSMSTEEPPTIESVLNMEELQHKMPRFLIRPTPGNPNNYTRPIAKLYSPEFFGLKGLSSYHPADPVEIIDGNSKVEVIATTPIITTTQHKVVEQRSTKPTMSPSPR